MSGGVQRGIILALMLPYQFKRKGLYITQLSKNFHTNYLPCC